MFKREREREREREKERDGKKKQNAAVTEQKDEVNYLCEQGAQTLSE